MSQSKMSLKACAKKLPCGHYCKKTAGGQHLCSCQLIWDFNPGCGHKVTGFCSKPVNIKSNMKCFATCYKPLDCGHRCKRHCYIPCGCHECLNLPKAASSKVPFKALGEPAGASSAPPSHPSASQPEASKAASTLAPMATSTATQPLSIPEPISRSPTLRLVPPADTKRVTWAMGPMDVTPRRLISPEMIQELRRYLPEPLFEPASPTDEIYTFSKCVNDHVFRYGLDNCPTCACIPYGDNVRVWGMTQNQEKKSEAKAAAAEAWLHDDTSWMDYDMAWKLGLAKCSKGHYYEVNRGRCGMCGEKVAFYVPPEI